MELILEAGLAGVVNAFLFVTGLVVTVTVGRARQSPLATATPFVLALLAVGQIGQGLGQRNVRAALEPIESVADKVTLLNAGTGEAAANLVLSGVAALLLAAVAAALGSADRADRAG